MGEQGPGGGLLMPGGVGGLARGPVRDPRDVANRARLAGPDMLGMTEAFRRPRLYCCRDRPLLPNELPIGRSLK